MGTTGTSAINEDQSDTMPLFDHERCSGCGRCVAACPHRLIFLDVNGYRKHAARQTGKTCSSCELCLESCPLEAITK